MPSYKLTYFAIKARAEPIRLLFVAADHKFEDVRVEFKDWPELKPTTETPQGVLPLLEFDAGRVKVKVSQSLAILRYLAKEFKLHGKTNLDALYIDQLVDTTSGVTEGVAKTNFEPDETKKAAMVKKFEEETGPNLLALLEDLVTASGKDGYSVGNSLTVADLTLYGHLEFMHLHTKLDKYPKLKAIRAKVESNKRIAAYLKTRPVTTL